MTAKPKPPDVEALVRLATEQATVLLPAVDLGEDWGTHAQHINLWRLDGKPRSDELLAAVKAAGAPDVAEALDALGTPYWRTVERLAAEHIGEEAAWRFVARAFAFRGVSPRRLLVVPE